MRGRKGGPKLRRDGRGASEDATQQGTFALTDERVLETDFGLDLGGANLSVKIFVITAEGNERGSNTVTVVRPAG